MNINEIYLISRLIDDNPVFPLSVPPKAKLLFDTAVDSLIRKNILKNGSEFTEPGAKTAKRIADYKSAKKYVKIGDLTFGYQGDGTAVLLQRSRTAEDYSFIRVNVKEAYDCVAGVYGFIKNNSCADVPVQSLNIKENELKERYKLGLSDCIYLSTLNVPMAAVTNELVFTTDNQLYLYDRNKEILFRMSGNRLSQILKERLAS